MLMSDLLQCKVRKTCKIPAIRACDVLLEKKTIDLILEVFIFPLFRHAKNLRAGQSKKLSWENGVPFGFEEFGCQCLHFCKSFALMLIR